jgi:hypothetical protein
MTRACHGRGEKGTVTVCRGGIYDDLRITKVVPEIPLGVITTIITANHPFGRIDGAAGLSR